MSTDDFTDKTHAPQIPNPPVENDSPIPDMVNTLKSVDTTSSEATQNAASMSDGKGGRITYTENLPKSDIHDH
ncbi:TPA: hypothetical protein DIV55_04255 [Patescibacteria group bacterium]|nr:hypothetical protein [Patescibacteria group bacterium]